MTAPSVRIWHRDLAFVPDNERLPVSALVAGNRHVHGELLIEIDGRLVPGLGYWGPNDVCLADWLRELWHAAGALERADGRHVFDEGEQAQPAFVFERVGDICYFSIAASVISGGEADPDWQRVPFLPADFVAAHERFRTALFAELRAAAPQVAAAWITQFGWGASGT